MREDDAAGDARPGTEGGGVGRSEGFGTDGRSAGFGSHGRCVSSGGDGPPAEGTDRATTLGVAVVLLALAGICALLGLHFLLGWLRILAGVLVGAAVGALILAAAGSGSGDQQGGPGPSSAMRRHRRPLAALVAVVLAVILTVPAVLAARPASLEDVALASIPALADDDRVISVPIPDSPVLIQRADGSAELLRRSRVDGLPAQSGQVLALSVEGTRLLRITGAASDASAPSALDPTVEVLDLTPDGLPEPIATVNGTPLALAGDVLVLRTCTDGRCHLSGHDLAAATDVAGDHDGEPPALWTITDGTTGAVRGADPAGTVIPARPDQQQGLLDAVRRTGIIPAVPLRFDPAQGWIQLDPSTGFPQGEVLAGPEEDCRIAPTAAPPGPPTMQEAGPVVLTVCSSDDGAMTAAAHREGALLWRSEPSPAGQWTIMLDQGRVLASGTEQGSDVVGEIVASQAQSSWSAPGGAALEDASAFTARIGIDGARMVVTNDAGQLVAYDSATGQDMWSLGVRRALGGPGDGDAAEPEQPGVQGRHGPGSVIVMDAQTREAPLEPRGMIRVRVLDAEDGDVHFEGTAAGTVEPVAAVGIGSALVTVGERTLLLGR